MTWFITGDRHALSLVVSKSGSFTAHGVGCHEFRPAIVADDVEDRDLARIMKAGCSWSLYSKEDGVEDLALLLGVHDRTRFESNSAGVEAILTYFAEPTSTIGVSILAPAAHLEKIERFLERLITRDDLEYTITLDFSGFRAPHARVDKPTMQEWLGATVVAPRPAFATMLSFRVRAKQVR